MAEPRGHFQWACIVCRTAIVPDMGGVCDKCDDKPDPRDTEIATLRRDLAERDEALDGARREQREAVRVAVEAATRGLEKLQTQRDSARRDLAAETTRKDAALKRAADAEAARVVDWKARRAAEERAERAERERDALAVRLKTRTESERMIDEDLHAIAADRDSARAEVATLRAQQVSPFKLRAAEALADEVAALVRRHVIDSRSPAADALLDFRDPPSTERADRLAALDREVATLRAEREGLGAWLRQMQDHQAAWVPAAEYRRLSADATALREHLTGLADKWERAALTMANGALLAAAESVRAIVTPLTTQEKADA